MKFYTVTISVLFTIVMTSCNKTENKAEDTVLEELPAPTDEIENLHRIDDSLAINKLLIDLHRWHLKTETVPDFDVYLAKPTDTLYAGIDSKKHEKRVAALKATGFFTDEFIENYNKIASTIDTGLKKGTAVYAVGELPPYGNDADPWTNSQDYPDDYWKKIILYNLTYNNDIISSTWSFGDNKYDCRFKKVDGKWKVDWLDGFDYKSFTEGLLTK